jgi:hypothetical protein
MQVPYGYFNGDFLKLMKEELYNPIEELSLSPDFQPLRPLLTSCWKLDPEKRPTAAELLKRIRNLSKDWDPGTPVPPIEIANISPDRRNTSKGRDLMLSPVPWRDMNGIEVWEKHMVTFTASEISNKIKVRSGKVNSIYKVCGKIITAEKSFIFTSDLVFCQEQTFCN